MCLNIQSFVASETWSFENFCGGPTERISSFVDSLLQPIAKKQESYIKDIRKPIRDNPKIFTKSEKIFLKSEKIFQIVMFFWKSSLKGLSNLKNNYKS